MLPGNCLEKGYVVTKYNMTSACQLSAFEVNDPKIGRKKNNFFINFLFSDVMKPMMFNLHGIATFARKSRVN